MSWIGIFAQSKNGVIGDKGRMPWPRNEEDLEKVKKTVKPREDEEGYICVMGRKTFETMKDYFPKAKKKGYPHAKRTIVLSSSMEEEPGVEIIRKVSELVEKYRNETIVVLGGANVFESVAGYLDKILITTFPEECEGDTYTPHLPAGYVGVDWEYLENRPEKYKDSKLKHEVWIPIRDSTSLAIVEICKYEQSIKK